MQSKLPVFKWSIHPSILAVEWSSVCKNLTSQQAVRLLHRFTTALVDHLKRGNRISDDSCHIFLERRVAHDVLNGRKISNSNNLSLYKSLELLHGKIIDLSAKSMLEPKHVSLSLNSYAKFYDNLTSNLRLYKFNLITSKQINNYVSQLLKIATKHVDYMNEQDLSLVLNCISKMNIKNHEFLNTSSELLNRSLEEFNRLGLNLEEEDDSDNLIKTMTPQGLALLLNCYSKSDVELNRSLIKFFVENYIPKMKEKFSINHLIMSLHGFLKYNVHLVKLLSSLKTADKMLSESCEHYTMKLISFALYTLSKYNFYPSLSINSMIEYVSGTSLSEASEVEMCNVYYALGKLNVRDLECLEHMNRSVAYKLKRFTPHAIVGIYHSLSRLDHKQMLAQPEFTKKVSEEGKGQEIVKRWTKGESTESEEQQTLEDKFTGEFIKFFKDKSMLTSAFNSNVNLTLLPIQLINFTFSCAINYNMDPWIYNFMLNKLICIIEKCPGEKEMYKKSGNILMSYREELASEDDHYKFLSKYVGIRGIYQINCILQHVLYYVEGGLQALDYELLSSLNTLLDRFRFVSDGNNKYILEDEIIESEIDEEEYAEDRVLPVTSRIHGNVHSLLEKVLRRGDEDDESPSELGDSKLFIYKEHEVVPYVIDIVIFKF
ncbi:hypothetical protein MACK_000264 [Theileria orientalis]|uniref:Uncharacterized protein n=1 Tax=Theileria orientalis TaxID=68886 RepID=A0A976M9J5_THEOR|nr:hypothetical protein MACK_000264 [Theileria orientalis]